MIMGDMPASKRRYVPGVTFGDLDTVSNPEPAWIQLYTVLRAAIEDGTYPPRAPMPSVRQIHEESGLARATIAKAFDRLRVEGLVVMIPGRGPFVATPRHPDLLRVLQQKGTPPASPLRGAFRVSRLTAERES